MAKDENVPVRTGAEAGLATSARAESRHPLMSLREEFDRLFDSFFAGLPGVPSRWRSPEAEPWRRFQSMFDTGFPTADIVEGEQAYKITAELPGTDEKEIEISVAGDRLTVKGEKKEKHEEKAGNRYVSERRYGAFERSFALPADADLDRIDAGFKNGVLTITVPKRPDAREKRRKIEVKAG